MRQTMSPENMEHVKCLETTLQGVGPRLTETYRAGRPPPLHVPFLQRGRSRTCAMNSLLKRYAAFNLSCQCHVLWSCAKRSSPC